MGAGLARQIAVKYPEVEHRYQEFVGNYDDPRRLIGHIQLIEVTPELAIINLFGQNELGGKATIYEAYPPALTLINKVKGKDRIHIPYGIGCGLGGGDWDVMCPLLQYYVPSAAIWKLP